MKQNNKLTLTTNWLENLKGKALLFPVLLLLFFGNSKVFAQTTYKATSNNLILNSTFDVDADNSPTVTNWTFTPAGDATYGWKEDKTLIYGNTLFIDREPNKTFTAASNPMTLCANTAKQVKFSFTSSSVGAYTLRVKLGGQLIGTLTNSGGLAQSIWTPAAGVTGTVYYNYWPEHYVNDGKVNNNIWHKFNLYIPNYTGATNGSLTFEYVKTGASRLVYLDNIEVYEAIPTPVPTKTTDTIATCGGTYDLTKLNPAVAGYTYTWYADANHTTPVATPTAVAPGTYYLFATNSCQPGYSYASTVVTIKGAPGCCGSNLVTNGSFNTYTTSGTNVGNSNIKGTPKVTSIQGWTYNPSLYAAVGIGNYPSGASGMLGLDPVSGQGPNMSQTINGIATADTQNLSFQFALEHVISIYQVRNVKISLGGTFLFNLSVGKDGGGNVRVGITGVNTAVVSNLKINGNTYTPPTKTPPDTGTGGDIFVVSVNQSPNPLYSSTLYNLSATLKGITSSTSDFTIAVNEGTVPFFDNVSISNNPPAAENPKDMNTATAGVIDGIAACPSNTFNLITANPNTTGHNYVWYSDSAGTTIVQDPTKVGPGTYYMKTVSTSGCESTTLTSFTVTSNCPTYSGKVFQDYNGASVNGIAATTNPATEVGTSGRGLYVAIVDATGKVINTTAVNGDGTFTLNGNGTAVKAILAYPQPVIGSTLTAAALQPNYVSTGEAINSTTPNGTADGISPTWAAGASTSNIYFGIQSKPIPGDASGTLCYQGINQPTTVPALYGVDEDPNFNSGVGRQVNFKSLSQTNGVLTYGGTPVTASTVIAAYDPAKLVFTPNDASQSSAASFKFTYTFTDIAGFESGDVATISYTFNVPGVASADQTICSGSAPKDLSVTGSSANSTFQWQISANGSTFTDITSATASTFQPGNLVQTTYYRAMVKLTNPDGSTCATPTNVVKITVSLANAPAPAIPANAMIPCGSTTTDISGIAATNTPTDNANAALGFFTSSTPSAANKVADITKVGAGTYYAAFYDTALGCYSTTTTPFVVYTELCVTQPKAINVFTGLSIQRDLEAVINPTGGSGNYTFTVSTGCTPPSGAAGTISGVAITGTVSNYTAPSTVGLYYYCVQVTDTGNPQQTKLVTIPVNVTAEATFPCDNSVYLTMYDAANNWSNIYQVLHNQNNVSIKLIGHSTPGILLNDIAYNFNDDKFYGIGSHGIVKVVTTALTNAVAELYTSPVTGLPSTSTLGDGTKVYNYNSGSFYQSNSADPTTNALYVMPQGTTNTLYRINIFDSANNGSATAVPLTGVQNGGVNVGDFTYIKSLGALVGYDSVSKQIVKIDPNTGAVTYVAAKVPNTVTQLAGIYTDSLGHVYGKDGTTGTLYELNMTNGQLYQIYKDSQFILKDQNGSPLDPSLYAYDATHCSKGAVTFPSDIVVTKTSPTTTYVPGQQVTYEITVRNDSPLYGVNSITVSDIMPSGLQNVSYYATPSGSAVETLVSTSSSSPSTGDITDTIYLPVGGSITYHVTATAAPGISGDLVNTVKVKEPSNFSDVNTAELTASVTLKSTVCYIKPNLNGTTLETPHGITALGRAGDTSSRWPYIRRGAWTVLEAKTKGFVVNRIATTAEVNNLPNPVEGMMVYDVEADCLKIYAPNPDGTNPSWRCLTVQTCPN